ncbi:PQQ-binding-like beta-propeller repeat protein [Halalkalibaculum sp. DA384]|uniref:outer membrane protein assembly factor BamB family protein n=1 Tax=Halalkalibaculum sp. DA384 TaxID=3373606 RepID=UPI00375421B9
MKSIKLIFPLLLIFVLFYGCQSDTPDSAIEERTWQSKYNNFTDWAIYRGDKKGNQYSTLDQINTENVHLLEPAWEYNTRELTGPGMQSNPIVIDGIMYISDPRLNLIALDATTGEEEWIFNPTDHYPNDDIVNGELLRGVTYWEDEEGNNERIFQYTRDLVWAVDPKTGNIIESFGDDGSIDLKENHVWDSKYLEDQIHVTTPGVTYKNYLIIGTRLNEGNTVPPGNIRAFDTITGEYKWTFHTVPQEGQFGYDTWEWEDNIIYGGANPWAGLTVDEERGWVFAATGSATGGIHGGGTSRKGKNLFSDTILALDATTGERQWHYQAIHHDIWDYDLPPPPMLTTIHSDDGESRDVVVQTGKHPTMLVLDRDTGEPIFPVVDKPVPTEAVPGEEPYPTQPWPLKPEPLVRTSTYESDLTEITPESHEAALEKFKKLKTGPVYTPPSIEGTITTPGIHGGNEWGGPSYDPETNTAYVNVNNIPFILTLVPMKPDQYGEMSDVRRGEVLYTSQCTACHGAQRQGSPGVPGLVNMEIGSDSIRTVISEGRGNMPAFPSISDEDMDHLITYLESEVEETSSADADTTLSFEGDHGFTWSGERDGLKWSTSTPQYIPELDYFTDHIGLPGTKPPWGELVAVDIERGEIKWKVPLGQYPVLTDSLGIDKKTGAENFGGPVTTAGGLIFIAATEDNRFRAFDKSNGELLWEFKMDSPGFSAPSVYEIDGKQYVAIVAGGGGGRFRAPISQPIGRTLHVFALPDSELE